MNTVAVLFWFACYTILSMALIVSLGRALIFKTGREVTHSALLGAFFMLVAGATPYSIFPDMSDQAREIQGFIGVAAISLCIYVVPALSRNLSSNPRRFPLRILSFAAVPLFATVTVSWFTPARIPVILFQYFFLVFCIVFVLVNGCRETAKNGKPALGPFWQRMTRMASIASAVYIPFLIIFDILVPIFFPQRGGLMVFPVFFVIWALTVMVESIREASRFLDALALASSSDGCVQDIQITQKLPPGAMNEGIMDGFGLSRREKEVVRHLAHGLSYKEIANTLFVSEATIKTHVARAYVKTGSCSKIDIINKLSLL